MAAEAGTEARARAAFDRLAAGLPGLGLALSGGGDSTALLHLAAEWGRARDVRLEAVTVDHGLRPGSAEEAAAAGQAATRLGVAHRTLRWQGPQPTGNLAAQARDARLALIGAWARDRGLAAVALGHTRDDVAETLLMRLGRGAGLDGLAAMADRRRVEGVLWLRPLLSIGRAELRAVLVARGATWAEDPSNDDLRRDRARIRAAMAALGLDPARLAESAAHLAGARDALVPAVAAATLGAAMAEATLTLHRAAFAAAPREVRRMVLVAAVATVTGAGYPPRRDSLAHALDALEAGRRVTLAGTLADPQGDTLTLTREPAAAARAAPLTADGVWDNRWRVSGLNPGDRVGAQPGSARPALWRDGAGPLPLPRPGVTAQSARGLADFRRKLGHDRDADASPH